MGLLPLGLVGIITDHIAASPFTRHDIHLLHPQIGSHIAVSAERIYVADQLNNYDLAYLHIVNPAAASLEQGSEPEPRALRMVDLIRRAYRGTLMIAGGFDRDTAEAWLEQGKAEFVDFSSRQFFEALLAITMEGFFADPIYGGNRDKVAWKMVGFPGLPATYANMIEQYRGKRYVAEPQSIADFS